MSKRKDPRSLKSQPQDPSQELAGQWQAFFDSLAEGFAQSALRAAMDGEGAVLRCNRRACKQSGQCNLSHVPGKPPECGGGISEAAVEKAVFGVWFGCQMVGAVFRDVVTAEPA